MRHGGDIYQKNIRYDFSVSLNPFVPKEMLTEAGMRALQNADCYPDLNQRKIRAQIADAEDVFPENVLAGNGASELLIGVVRFLHPKRVLLFTPGYSGYEYAVDSLVSAEKIYCSTKKENGYLPSCEDLDAILSEGKKPEMIFLCNPWNPTGKLFSADELVRFLKRAEEEGIYVVLDLSFWLLSSESGIGRTTDVSEIIKRYPRTVILKSFTKFLALPGIRMGYLIGQKDFIKGVRNTLPEWNLSVPAEYILEEGLKLAKNADYLKLVNELLQKEREYLSSELASLGMEVFESDSCFLYFRSEKEIAGALCEKGILIREYAYEEYPRGLYYRIAVKEHAKNVILTECLKKICEKRC